MEATETKRDYLITTFADYILPLAKQFPEIRFSLWKNGVYAICTSQEYEAAWQWLLADGYKKVKKIKINSN